MYDIIRYDNVLGLRISPKNMVGFFHRFQDSQKLLLQQILGVKNCFNLIKPGSISFLDSIPIICT